MCVTPASHPFQGWNTRVPGKYKVLILDTATEELGHVEMISIMIARLLEAACRSPGYEVWGLSDGVASAEGL